MRIDKSELSGLIPAYAGNTFHLDVCTAIRRAHPRLRGEHSPSHAGARVAGGSSPLTRGTRDCSVRVDSPPGLIPAYAGNTESHHGIPVIIRAHPRLRGEHSITSARKSSFSGSSPLTRGTQKSGGRLPVPLGLIPAYAGNTCAPGPRLGPRPAHPRLRGEHIISMISRFMMMGSSPLTRGTRQHAPRLCRNCGLIPAYAGNTISPPTATTK